MRYKDQSLIPALHTIILISYLIRGFQTVYEKIPFSTQVCVCDSGRHHWIYLRRTVDLVGEIPIFGNIVIFYYFLFWM